MGLVDQSVLDQSVLEGGISTAEAARVLGLNVQTVRKYIWRGKLNAVPVQSRRGFRWRVLVDEVSAGAGSPIGEGSDGADSLDKIAALAEELARVQGRLGLAREELAELTRRVKVDRLYGSA